MIGGTSHAGKSTLAEEVAQAVGLTPVSTDRLGRHPGRPWPTVRPHVAEFYARLSPESIFAFLLAHHENMWPGLRRFIGDHLRNGHPFVLEGSALRPDYLATLEDEGLVRLYLYGPPELIRTRIHMASGYETLGDAHRQLIDAFVERSLRDNEKAYRDAEMHGIRRVDVSRDKDLKGLAVSLIASLRE